jgi:hypothetical protein
MLSIDQWDEAYVLANVVNADESESFERKRTKVLGDNKAIAKSVCAFANAGEGIIVYGLEDKSPGSPGALDPTGGVQATLGGQSVESWLLEKIPKFHQPPITSCTAKFVVLPSAPGGAHGILALSVSLSERRPHWSTQTSPETPYLRVGEHSAPMRLQTLLDISSRGLAPTGEIGTDCVFAPVVLVNQPVRNYRIQPTIRIASGPICKTWGVEFALVGPLPGDDLFQGPQLGFTGERRGGDEIRWFFEGKQTLFTGRWSTLDLQPWLKLMHEQHGQRKIRISLFLEAAVPVHCVWAAVRTGKPEQPFEFRLIENNQTSPIP